MKRRVLRRGRSGSDARCRLKAGFVETFDTAGFSARTIMVD